MTSANEQQPSRTCSQCGQANTHVAFGTRGSICIPCRRERGRAHYAANRDYYLAKARRRNAATTARVRAWLLTYLVEHPCVDCATTDIRVLEFDHIDRDLKRAAVSVLAANGYSLDTVKREVETCEVRCANCHTIRTRSQLGWWRENC